MTSIQPGEKQEYFDCTCTLLLVLLLLVVVVVASTGSGLRLTGEEAGTRLLGRFVVILMNPTTNTGTE